MDHDSELLIPDPGNIWKINFSKLSTILEILEISAFLISTMLEILEIEASITPRILEIRAAGGGGRAAPGVVLCCLGLFLQHGKTSMVTLELRSKQALF